ARVGALALERLDQAGLLAADVGAGAAVHVDLAGVAGAEDVLADEIVLARLLDGAFENAGALGHLAADIDVGLLHVVRETGNHRALDQLVRILVDDVAVLEGAGLGFVGVDDQVDRLAGLAVHQAPLDTTGETRAAAAAQTGLLDLLVQVLGFARDGRFEDLVTAMAQVAADVVGVTGLVDVLENDAALFGHGGQRWAASALMRAASSFALAQSTFSWSCSSIITTGAVPQLARHSTNSIVTS